VKPPATPVAADTSAAAKLNAALPALPQGVIETPRPYDHGQPPNIPFSQITQWTDEIQLGFEAWPDVPRLLGEDAYSIFWAVLFIESGGNQFDRYGRVLEGPDRFGGCTAKGGFQLKDCYWAKLDPQADWRTAAGNARLAAAFFAHHLPRRGNDWRRVIREDYHPGTSSSGVTPQSYVDTAERFIVEAKRKTGLPPAPVADPIVVITGGVAFNDDYGFGDRAGVNYGNYGPQMGMQFWDSHPGIDVVVPEGTVIYAVAAGTVGCVGQRGTPQRGRSCGYYEDDHGGAGNLTVKLDDVPGVPTTWVTYGHMHTTEVKPGDRVVAGQRLGTVGHADGYHVHLETSRNLPDGRPWLYEPREALRPYLTSVNPVPTPKPVIRDLADDAVAARYGLTPVERDRLLGKCTPNRGGNRVQAIALHIQQGTTAGSLDHHANAVSASATYYANRDGSIVYGIREQDAPWTNGDVKSPDATVRQMRQQWGADPNQWTVTIEAEGYPEQPLTEQQFASIVWLVKDLMQRHQLGAERIIGHYQINSLPAAQDGRAFCGRYKDQVIAAVTGSVPVPGPQYAPLSKPPAFDGTDKVVNGVTFVAAQRRYTAKKAGVPVLQWADPKAKPVREPLADAEAFTGHFLIEGEDKKLWIVTNTGARIPASGATPVVTVKAA
jgi:hypothetical protein